MDASQLRKLVQEGESDQIEFKRKVRHPEKIVRELVAFANTKGGHLFIGVNDDLTIPGLKHPEEEDFIMQKSLVELVSPQLVVQMEMIKLSESRSVVHYYIPESTAKPHYAVENKKQRWGKAYVRVEDKTVQASREVCQILKSTRRQNHQSFLYGENERKLMNYLGKHDHITLSEYLQLAELRQREASDILINLTLNNVLRVIPREKEDWFVHVD